MAVPGHPPDAGRGGCLINTAPRNGGSTSRAISEIPPSYSDLFPRPSPPCNMDPLVEAMWHNQAISPLPRLPDNVLKAVIQNLDGCSVECLRRVSRRFTPLCDEEILTRPHTFQPRVRSQMKIRGGPFAWPRFEVFSGPWSSSAAGERQRLLQLLARDWYCEGCREARAAPDWDRRVERLTSYLYCHSCNAEHPACLFSAQQRRSSTILRQCIAHEGYFRLCQHDEGIVRWSEISRIRQRLDEGVEDEDDYELSCEHISHFVSCARTRTHRSGQTVFYPGCDDPGCIERPSPTLQVAGSKLWLYWTAHLPVPSNDQPLAASDLRSRIAKIRERCGRFLYPDVAYTGNLPEMRCFDPNDCDCVLLEGQEEVEMRFDSLLHSKTVCRLNTSRRLYPLRRSSSLGFAPSLVGGIRRLLLTHKWRFRRECGASRKRHRARLDFNPLTGPGKSDIQCWPCHAGNSCLVLDYHRLLIIGCDGAIGAQWYQALEPESYNLTEDEEGFGVYWCRQKECRNYHGRVPGFSRIVRGEEYHRSVDAYWSSVVM